MRQYMLPFLNWDVWLLLRVVKAPNNQNKERKPDLVLAHGLETIYKKKIDAEKLNLFTMLRGEIQSGPRLILLSFP